MVAYSNDDYVFMVLRRLTAFKKIADSLGKDHPITKMMGGRAWGRHRYERGTDVSLRSVVEEFGSLNGAFDILNTWAGEYDRKAQRIMIDLYPRGMEKRK